MALPETPGLELDHIVIAAKSHDEGARFIQEKLGTDIPAGGKHPLMGTHNCLMRLGSSAFLEVIAIDPDAEGPGGPRWYSLDDLALQQRLEVSPQLIAWVLRTRNIEHDALTAGYSAEDVISVSRGTLSWRLTVPADGSLPWGGAFPHLIQWDHDVQPWEQMADRNAGLERLHIRHPEAMRLASILSRLMGDIPAYATISEADRSGLGAELKVDGRVVTL
jgi:hypothetical protein